MSEKIPDSEFSPEELELIGGLKTKGPEDTETRARFLEWYDGEAARAQEANTARANAEFTLKRLRVYFAAGLLEEGVFDDLRLLVIQADALRDPALMENAQAFVADAILHTAGEGPDGEELHQNFLKLKRRMETPGGIVEIQNELQKEELGGGLDE